MAKIYSAININNGNEVALFHNDVKARYEVIVKGNHIKTYVCNSLNVANRIYNEELR